MLQLSVKTTGVSSLLCNDRFWETNITAAIGSLWAHFWNKLEKKKLCWHTGPCWFFLQNDHILFLEARPDEAMPGYATKQGNPQHPDIPLWPFLICTHSSFPLLIMRIKQQNESFSDCACICELQRWPHSFLFCSVLHLTKFCVQQSSSSCMANLPVLLCSTPVLLPVGPGFKPARTPSPMWSSGWGLLGCWQISAECWSEGKPALEFGPVHPAWLGGGPGAGRCWPAGVQTAWDSAAGPTIREQDQTIVHWRQQWECSGWTGAAGVEVEWRKQEGGTGSPCAQLKK